MRAFAAALVTLLAAACATAEEGLPQLLQQVLDAYGGEEALARVGAVRERGRLYPKVRHAGQVGTFLRLSQDEDHLRVEVAYPDGDEELRVLDGERGWRNGVEVDGPARDAMALQAARLALPRLLQQRADALVDLGRVERADGPRRRLELPLGGGLALGVEIEAASGRILQSSGRLSFGPGRVMEFTTEYGDFRDVDGVLFAFRERSFAGPVQTADTRLETVEILSAPPPGAFAPERLRARWRAR